MLNLLPSKMGSVYSVKGLPESARKRVRTELTLTPKNSDQPFQVYDEDEEWMHMPRFYGRDKFGSSEEVLTTEGDSVEFGDFSATLSETQKEATSSALERFKKGRGAMIELPCGEGKTVCALYVAHACSVRTIVLVHTSVLLDQWFDRCSSFLPSAKVGRLVRDVDERDADICVCMIQSLLSRQYDLSAFGLCVVDEAHHMAAREWYKASALVPCSLLLGLSATKERKDGLTRLLDWTLGSTCFAKERKLCSGAVTVLNFHGGKRKEILKKDGSSILPIMLNFLSEDSERNLLIIRHIKRLQQSSRRILVLSDRLSQLHYMKTHVPEAVLFVGATSKADRERAIKDPRVLFSTFILANEGLDIPMLDTLIMATPKADVTQSVGRIQRSFEGKQRPLVLDIVDTFGIFNSFKWKRLNMYKKQGMEIQQVEESTAAEHLFK
jgi:superfamily II DNA or RNA helicase